ADEGIEEGESGGDVPGRTERLDQPDLYERGRQSRLADVPIDPHSGFDERATLTLLLPAPGRPVLLEAPAQARCLADVEQGARRAIEAVDTRLRRHAGQEVAPELLIEEPHAAMLGAARPPPEAFSRRPGPVLAEPRDVAGQICVVGAYS